MADAIDWHGWRFGFWNLTVHVGPLPRRKQFALSIETPGKVTPIAYFVDEESAQAMRAIMDGIADRMNAMERKTDG